MTGVDAVLGAGGAHADDFLRAEVGGDEGEAADPGRDGAAGEKEVVRGAHVALEGEADAQNEDEIDQHDEPVDDGQSHGFPLGSAVRYGGSSAHCKSFSLSRLADDIFSRLPTLPETQHNQSGIVRRDNRGVYWGRRKLKGVISASDFVIHSIQVED